MHSQLIQRLDKIKALSSGSKLKRIISNPIKYISALGHREVIHPVTKSPFIRTANLFWGDNLNIALPSGVDMYILGAKGDDSEIRLSKYLIRSIQPGNSFIDVGAHFGYYSQLAAHLAGDAGRVISCEPASAAFELLKENTERKSIIEIHNALIGSRSETVTFYEFPTKYAEYNSIDIEQYRTADWFDEGMVTQSQRKSITLDDLISIRKVDFIKIDVEGAEYEVLLGAQNLMQSSLPTIGLEYVQSSRSNSAHQSAVNHLRNLDYKSYLILASGDLEIVNDLDRSLYDRQLESDNFIFSHPSNQNHSLLS